MDHVLGSVPVRYRVDIDLSGAILAVAVALTSRPVYNNVVKVAILVGGIYSVT